MILTKIKKKKKKKTQQQKKKTTKKHAKIKSFLVHLFLLSLIILVTLHTIFASFYFALVQYIHDIEWNTLNLEMAVWSEDLPPPLMAIFSTSHYSNMPVFRSKYGIYQPQNRHPIKITESKATWVHFNHKILIYDDKKACVIIRGLTIKGRSKTVVDEIHFLKICTFLSKYDFSWGSSVIQMIHIGENKNRHFMWIFCWAY